MTHDEGDAEEIQKLTQIWKLDIQQRKCFFC